ncbi:hypothetical protein ACFVGY_35255 [Streptomyces sp. NPDC127106]|uniref:hypothetical protein n=1 Tax=Streptomyces sp. NPDC127106 TaxID=3345360 RepID=UPI00363FEA0F
MICRDRCSTFSQAAARAAPDATEVADRWHLLHTPARAVERTAAAGRPTRRPAPSEGLAISVVLMVWQSGGACGPSGSCERERGMT